MDKKSTFDSRRVNDYYIKTKENEIKKLEEKKRLLEQQILNEKALLDENKALLIKREMESKMLTEQYESLVRMVENNGLTFDIENKNYEIKEWDNLTLAKRGTSYIILSKKGEELEMLNRETSFILEHLLSEKKNYSFVVVRITKKNIRAQFRINKVSE